MEAVEKEREGELARRLIAGDVEAFDRFIDYFRPKIFQYSWLMCGDREDAEEVAQDALVKVFENLAQLREPERVRAWVFRIAKNACLMKRRKSVFAPSRELSLDEFLPSKDGGGRLEIADWSNLPEDKLLQAEINEVLRRAIGDLPETYRATLLLRDVEGLSTHDTAEVLDVSEDAVKTRLHRARLAVRKILDEYLRTGHGAPAPAYATET